MVQYETRRNFAFYLIYRFFDCQVKYSEEQGTSPDNSARLLMFYGLSSCIARLLAGRVCDLTWVNPHYVFQVGNFIAALSVIFAPLARSYIHFLLCGLFFGLGAGISISTSNLVFLTCVDEKRRASAFGLASCLGSFAILSAPPLAGKYVSCSSKLSSFLLVLLVSE